MKNVFQHANQTFPLLGEYRQRRLLISKPQNHSQEESSVNSCILHEDRCSTEDNRIVLVSSILLGIKHRKFIFTFYNQSLISFSREGINGP